MSNNLRWGLDQIVVFWMNKWFILKIKIGYWTIADMWPIPHDRVTYLLGYVNVVNNDR